MKTSDFSYHLPEELIAQFPLKDRSGSRLLTLDKKTGAISHKKFTDILDLLNAGDVLVRNHSRVIPARLYGKKIGGEAQVEVLLLNQISSKKDTWEALVRPGKRLKVGSKIRFSENLLGTITAITSAGRLIEFEYSGIFNELLASLGEMPLPPYIKEKLEEKERYQTVYSKVEGSAAAPTAGLHFTHELFEALRKKGVIVKDVVLHVGLGTFKPVQVDNIQAHEMHVEYYEIPQETAMEVNLAKKEGRRVVALGTTSARALESGFNGTSLESASGKTNIFIYPGYEWKLVDALITNFHLPESTLMMLVSALASKAFILNAYKEAVNEKYRFFSFGDAMFIS